MSDNKGMGASAPIDFDDDMLRTMLGAAAYRARRVSRTLKLSPSECEDAEQEILLTLLERRRFFDSSRSQWATFASRIARQAAQLVADDFARARSFDFNAVSLDEPQDSDAGEAHHLSLPDENVPTEQDILNALSVRSFVRRLPENLRMVAEAALAAEGDIAEAQRSTALSSSEFYRRLNEIRIRMLMIGLVRRRRGRPLGKNSDRQHYITRSGAREAAKDTSGNTGYPIAAKRMTG